MSKSFKGLREGDFVRATNTNEEELRVKGYVHSFSRMFVTLRGGLTLPRERWNLKVLSRSWELPTAKGFYLVERNDGETVDVARLTALGWHIAGLSTPQGWTDLARVHEWEFTPFDPRKTLDQLKEQEES